MEGKGSGDVRKMMAIIIFKLIDNRSKEKFIDPVSCFETTNCLICKKYILSNRR